MGYIIKEFIREVVNELNRVNKPGERTNANEKPDLDITFIVSVLTQHLQDEEFKSFVTDISNNKYNITYEDIDTGYYDYGKINVILYNETTDTNENYNYQDLGYNYSIILCYDQRDWGYCECTPNDKDYNKDKGCCGHGCDWWAPAFRIVKEILIGHEVSWNGDEHDFWDFENNFYKSEKELEIEKQKRDKESKIKYLQDNIGTMKKELSDLLKGSENN